MNDYIFTSESVSAGHQIRLQTQRTHLDAGLKAETRQPVAVETLVTTQPCNVGGRSKKL